MPRKTKADFGTPSRSVFPPKAPPAPSEQSEMRPVRAEDVHKTIRSFAEGWGPDIEKALMVPDQLFMWKDENTGAMVFSSDKVTDMFEVLLRERAGSLESYRPRGEYGIAIYETTTSNFLILVDMRRNLIVRSRLSNFMSEPEDWKEIARKIESAGKEAISEGRLVYS